MRRAIPAAAILSLAACGQADVTAATVLTQTPAVTTGPRPGQVGVRTVEYLGPVTSTEHLSATNVIIAPPGSDQLPPKVTWSSVWSQVCRQTPGTCSSTAMTHIVLASVTDTNGVHTNQLMYVAQTDGARCLSLGGPVDRPAATSTPSRSPRCTVRSYYDANSGHWQFTTSD